MNLAARVEGLTRQFGVPIVVTEFTAEGVKPRIGAEDGGDDRGRLGHVVLRRIESVKLKGKDRPVVAYALERLDRQASSVIIDEGQESVRTLEAAE